ncbi:hypothetical protein PAMA_003655 [Pampus argenteus]
MASSVAVDVQVALQRAKKKICSLQRQASNTNTSESSADSRRTTWMHSKELQDSLVDMYTANPRVNVELRQRLPSPARQQLINPDRFSPEHTDWPQAPQHLQQPLSNSPSPRYVSRSVSPEFPRSFRPPGGVGEMDMDLSPSQGLPPLSDGPDGSPTVRKYLVNTVDSCHQDSVLEPAEASAQVQLPERNRNVSLLLKELDTLREINKKLQDQLIHKEKELQRREVDEQLREELREARGWERPTAVLEEVLAAQKDRDQALMSRLLLANEERDEALLRARRLQQAAELENMNLEDTDMEVDELLQCICNGDSMQEVEHFGSILVQRVRMARQRQNYITAQEMKAVMEERDGSVAKVGPLTCLSVQVGAEHQTQKIQSTRRAHIRLLFANILSYCVYYMLYSYYCMYYMLYRNNDIRLQVSHVIKKRQNLLYKMQQQLEMKVVKSARCQKVKRYVKIFDKLIGKIIGNGVELRCQACSTINKMISLTRITRISIRVLCCIDCCMELNADGITSLNVATALSDIY